MNSKERNKAFGFYGFSLLDKLFLWLRLHIVKQYVNFNNKSVLDVGCGYNATSLQYIQQHYSPKSMTALDLNLNTESLGKLGINCLLGNLEKGITGETKYDIILATAILEHIQNDSGFVQSCFDHLETGGMLVITTPSIWSQPVLEFLAYQLHVIEEVEIRDHKRYYDKKILIDIFEHAGFEKSNITHTYFECRMNNFVIAKK